MEFAGIYIVGLIIGISEVFKKAGINNRYIPILNLILGLLAGMFLLGDDIKSGVVIGIFIGLSASGLYSGAKNTLDK